MNRPALALAALLTTTGTIHLVRPHTFYAALPDWLPGSKRAWAIGSGLAELACAGCLWLPRTQRAGGYASTALFVGVFPGNVHMVTTARSPRAKIITVLRLPLQVPLVWWAWRVARH